MNFLNFFQAYRKLKEEIVANAVSTGAIAGANGDPPVFPKKKKKTVMGFISRAGGSSKV